MPYRHIVVGAGLTGSVIARLLADAGRRVLVVERRAHIGGNVADALHPSGIRHNLHGPHYFRTSSRRVWNFVTRFSAFEPYAACVKALVDGRHESWPVTASYIRRVASDWRPPESTNPPLHFEDAVLRRMPRAVYECFVRDYTEKQWGCPPRMLSVSLARRVEVRAGNDPRLTPRHRFQGLPRDGYHAFVARMLDGIPVETSADFLDCRDAFRGTGLTIFTGGIDEYFGYSSGRLAYRCQRRDYVYHEGAVRAQPVAQVNTPQHADGPAIRSVEWKHLAADRRVRERPGTLVTSERPHSAEVPDEREYPMPDVANTALYARYRHAARAERDVLICGRLGEYRYLDMDQAIGRAMVLACRILSA
jgi:UDP-galactopyranose mutase